MPERDELYDAVIVGGGAAGLSAALMLGRCRRKVLVIDAGHPRNSAARGINGYLGHDGIPPRALLQLGREEAQKYGVEVVEGQVTRAEATEPCDRRHRTCFQLNTE